MRSQHTTATDAAIAFAGNPIEDRIQIEKRRAKQDSFLALLGTHGWNKAATLSGCDINDVSRWKRLDSEFADRLKAENETIADSLERIVDDIARGNVEATPSQCQLLQFRLRALKPSVYRERQSVELTGANGGAIQIGEASRARLLLAEWAQNCASPSTEASQ